MSKMQIEQLISWYGIKYKNDLLIQVGKRVNDSKNDSILKKKYKLKTNMT